MKHIGKVLYATLVGAVYDSPVLEVDPRVISSDELVETIHESIGSYKIRIKKKHSIACIFPWDSQPSSKELNIEEALDYLYQEAAESDLIPLTKIRICPTQYRFGKTGYTLIADTETAGEKKIPMPDVISMELVPVYR